MAIADTPSILFVAAEAREFAGLLKHAVSTRAIPSSAAFARETELNGARCILIANGPGPRLVNLALDRDFPKRWNVQQVISTGFCGALDPHLKIGDIVVSGAPLPSAAGPYRHGEIWSIDEVAVTAVEKGQLRNKTGASVVEMEFAAVQAKAREWGLPCRAIRVVSDTAAEDLPLNFNDYRDADGRFQFSRIAFSGLASPFRVLPALLRLDRNSKEASEKLGAFLADCQF
ncbi:MAG: hypothetical protein ABI995_02755 [Acidobacteriota bacterium]